MSTGDSPALPHGRWLRIVPPTIIIYIIAYMDRMNISFAIAGGMNKSLGLSMTTAGLAAGVFFFGYMLLQVPAGHIAEHGSAKKYILWTIVAWGGISLLTAFVQNAWQLFALRFLLGVAEGGVYPGPHTARPLRSGGNPSRSGMVQDLRTAALFSLLTAAEDGHGRMKRLLRWLHRPREGHRVELPMPDG